MSLGRLIFFDQPGTGHPILLRPARCRPWSSGPTALPRFWRSRQPRSGPGGDRRRRSDRGGVRGDTSIPDNCTGRAGGLRGPQTIRTDAGGAQALAAMWGTGEFQHPSESGYAMNGEIRATWARMERWPQAPRPSLSWWRSCRKWMSGPCFPQSVCRHSLCSRRGSADRAAMSKYVADHIPDAKYVELPGRNMYHCVEHGGALHEILNSSPGTKPRWPTIGSRHRPLHRHRGLDAERRRARRPRLAGAA